ncbi:MAG: hypothetical protein H0W50_06295 [Parachlamydiaceae bacterium]|nr:hypothetical protein [Parachlamydiaceae bacterium]
MSHDFYWHQIIIDDPACLPGKIIYDVIQVLLCKIEFKYVVLDDIEGAAQKGLIPILRGMENSVLELDEFMSIVREVQQFDFGDFFLFKEYPKKWSNGTSYPHAIAQTDTTVRAIDDQYVYIYTPYQEIVDVITSTEYKIESIKTDTLEKLEYPG